MIGLTAKDHEKQAKAKTRNSKDVPQTGW